MSAPNYVTAGGLRVDYLITRQGQACNGLPGGNALYAAAGASLWTEGIAVWGRYGASYPQQWLHELATFNLITAGLIPVSGAHDHRTFYAYTRDGRRDDTNPAAHYARFGLPLPEELADYVDSTPHQDNPHLYEPLAPRPEDWPDAFTAVAAVHLSPLPLSTHLHVPPELRRRAVKQITIDPGERYMIPQRAAYLRQLLPYVDAFLPSDQEVASMFGRGTDLVVAARTLCQWGAPLVVVKLGAEGVLILDAAENQPYRLPAYHQAGDSRVVDVTGAGDAFCGGFMVGLAQTGDAILAAQMGIVSASVVIEGYGALYALQVPRQASQARLDEISSRGKVA